MTEQTPEVPFHRRWPSLQAMIAEPAKLLYLPIAKCACTSLKSLMVHLADLPEERRRAILKNVHAATDEGATGLQIKDHDEARIAAILADPDWLKIAVVRDPHERLVSAYVEKFVIRRERKGVTTAATVAAVQGASVEEADLARGITFTEFVAAVTAAAPMSLDPHWRPQILSFADIACDRVCAIEHLELLEGDLSARLKRPVEIPSLNRARKDPRRHMPGVADLLPGAIEAPREIAAESFYTPATHAAVARAYAADATLHRLALATQAARAHAHPKVRPAQRPWRKRLSVDGIRRAMGG